MTNITVTEGQVARVVDSTLVRIENVDVAHEESDRIRARRPAGSRCAKPLAKFLQCVIGLVVKVNDSAFAIQLL